MKKVKYLILAVVLLAAGIGIRISPEPILTSFGIKDAKSCTKIGYKIEAFDANKKPVKLSENPAYIRKNMQTTQDPDCIRKYRKYAMILTILSGAFIGGAIGAFITAFKKK